MERAWFEKRKRLLRNLGYVNLVLFVVFFVFYLVLRSSAIEASYNHYSTHEQLQNILDARRRAELGFWLTIVTAIVGLACLIKKSKLQNDYNAQIRCRSEARRRLHSAREIVAIR